MALVAEGLIRAPTVVGASRLRIKNPPSLLCVFSESDINTFQ